MLVALALGACSAGPIHIAPTTDTSAGTIVGKKVRPDANAGALFDTVVLVRFDGKPVPFNGVHSHFDEIVVPSGSHRLLVNVVIRRLGQDAPREADIELPVTIRPGEKYTFDYEVLGDKLGAWLVDVRSGAARSERAYASHRPWVQGTPPGYWPITLPK